jgi:hypothetical protein
MPSRQLIYLTVFGTNLRPLAEACVQSLRVAGRFRGDVWVFCDHPPLAVEAEHRPADARTEWEHICAARIDLGLTLPFEQYDQIGDLFTFVNGQLTATDGTGGIPAGFLTSLGDINGQGTGVGTGVNATHIGNVVKIQHPSVRQLIPNHYPQTVLSDGPVAYWAARRGLRRHRRRCHR